MRERGWRCALTLERGFVERRQRFNVISVCGEIHGVCVQAGTVLVFGQQWSKHSHAAMATTPLCPSPTLADTDGHPAPLTPDTLSPTFGSRSPHLPAASGVSPHQRQSPGVGQQAWSRCSGDVVEAGMSQKRVVCGMWCLTRGVHCLVCSRLRLRVADETPGMDVRRGRGGGGGKG